MELWAQNRTDWSGVLENCTQCSSGLFQSLFPLWTVGKLQVSDCRLSFCEKSRTTAVHFTQCLRHCVVKLSWGSPHQREWVYSSTNYCNMHTHNSSLPFLHCKEIPHLHHLLLSAIHIGELINHLRRGMTETDRHKCSSYNTSMKPLCVVQDQISTKLCNWCP